MRVAIETPALLGESPMWHPREQVLYYCDIPGRSVQRFDPQTDELRRWQLESEVASLAPMSEGRELLLACRDGLWRFDPDTGKREPLAPPPYDPVHERFNDGKCDPAGRFWVGTIYEPRNAAQASLHRYDGRLLKRMADGITVSNGLAWSLDGQTLYWSDTKAHSIYASDIDPLTGDLGSMCALASFPLKPTGHDLTGYGGRPDGAAMDVEGCYWVAMFEGQRVLRLSPQGTVIAELPLPVRCPTMPCFGGPDMKTLYITTSRENRPEAELRDQPWAGRVLSVQLDVAGLPANCFCVAAEARLKAQ